MFALEFRYRTGMKAENTLTWLCRYSTCRFSKKKENFLYLTLSVFLFYILAAVLNLTSLAFMVSWQPSPEDQYLLFALIGAWGFADGIWQSQINSMFMKTIYWYNITV